MALDVSLRVNTDYKDEIQVKTFILTSTSVDLIVNTLRIIWLFFFLFFKKIFNWGKTAL